MLRLALPLLSLLTLIYLSACSQDQDIQATHQRQATPTPYSVHLSSENTGEQLTLSLDSDEPQLNTLGTEHSLRSVSFGYTHGDRRIGLRLERQEEYNILIILRPQGGHQFTYAIRKWKHKKNTRKIYLRDAQIQLPAGTSYAANAWEAMLVLVPDDLTEQQLKAQGYKLPYSSVIATGAPVKLSEDHTFPVEVPFASSWTPLRKQQHELYGNEFVSHSFVLKPLGAFVIYSVQNNMNAPIQLEGFKVVSNAIAAQAKLNLEASQLAQSAAGSAVAHFSDYGEVYTDRSFEYKLPITSLASKARANLGYIVWYPTTGAVTRTSFDYNDGTPPTDLGYSIRYSQNFRSQDPIAAARYATTHVYALGASKAGRPITKPNLSIVPIMGTDKALSDGKFYRMNCELYEQPELQLGYFAKSPLTIAYNADRSAHFALADARTLSNDNIPLLGLYDDLANYVDASDPHNPKMRSGIPIDGQSYYLSDNALMRATGLLSTNVVFFADRIYGGSGGGWPSVAAGRGVYNPRAMRSIEDNGTLSPSSDAAIITYSDVQTHAGTCLMYRSNQLSSTAGRPVRNINQAIYRIQAKVDQGQGAYYISSISVRALYLGKYYVGDVAPFIAPSFWSNPAAAQLQNSVERTFYVGGKYVETIRNETRTGEYSARYAAGELGAYWALDSYQLTPDVYNGYHASPIIGSWGLYGDDQVTGTATQNWLQIWSNWNYRVAHPYSTTYQGD